MNGAPRCADCNKQTSRLMPRAIMRGEVVCGDCLYAREMSARQLQLASPEAGLFALTPAARQRLLDPSSSSPARPAQLASRQLASSPARQRG